MITVAEIAERIGASLSVKGNTEKVVTNCYISDLLSDVMAKGQEGELWITLQTHPNIVAVAVIKGISAIVLTNNRHPEPETARKAEKEDLAILVYPGTTFDAAGKIYTLLNEKK